MRVDVPDPPDIVLVLNEVVGPAGDTVALRLTAPLKLLMGETMMVVETELPD